MENLSSVLRRRRKELGLTLLQIAEEMNVSEATVQRWESGNIKMLRHERIAKLAQVLKVAPSSLMGWEEVQPELPSNVIPLPQMKKVPLVGQIACGTPILAEQNITDYIDLPAHISADYALTCKGESMINIGIEDGDIVYIRQQKEVENGQVAAVMVGDDEATLKRFYYEDGIVQLIAENSAIPPKVFVGEAINQVRVIGRAMAYTHIIE